MERNIKRNKRKKQLKSIKTYPWGAIYIMLVPMYALIYYFMPAGRIDFGDMPHNALSCLYLSMSTVTTLGIGDISPNTPGAAVLIGSECFIGVIVAGLFLNTIAFKKSEEASREKDRHNEISRYEYECEKLLQFSRVIEVTLNHYEASVLALLDNEYNSIEKVNENLQLRNMTNIFRPAYSGRMKELSYSRLSQFMTLTSKTVRITSQLIREINMEYWPAFQGKCVTYIDQMADTRAQEFFTRLEKKGNILEMWENGFDGMAEDISNRLTHTVPENEDEIFTPFLDLRDMIVNASAYIVAFRKDLYIIEHSDPERFI